MTTLDEAIKHAEEIAKSKCDECGREHKQLAVWLKELKEYREQEPTDEWQNGYDMAWEEAKVFYEVEPCEDAVSRQAVLDTIANWIICEYNYTNATEYLKRRVSELPSVQPKAKTGHWIAQDIHNCHTDFKCSECGYIHNFMHLYGEPTADYTYCPNCGARMSDESV